MLCRAEFTVKFLWVCLYEQLLSFEVIIWSIVHTKILIKAALICSKWGWFPCKNNTHLSTWSMREEIMSNQCVTAPESLGFFLTGQTEELPSNLSSPVLDTPLDSPLSCADLTLDSTGEITVEDVRDFLTYEYTLWYFSTLLCVCVQGTQWGQT